MSDAPALTDRDIFLSQIAADASSSDDPIHHLQDAYAMRQSACEHAIYTFGAPKVRVFSDHADHSNRLVPVYTFGAHARLDRFTGANSAYRSADGVRGRYGCVPPRTVHRAAEYADMTDLHRLLAEAVGAGVRHLFVLWLDGCDWQTTQAAAILRSGKSYRQGRGSGLLFQDYSADGTTQYGYAVTSPSQQRVCASAENQSVDVGAPGDIGLPGGYDADFGGLTPWHDTGATQLAYGKGQQASAAEQRMILESGGVMHAVTDSAASASALASGAKVFNDSLNIDAQGNLLAPLFVRLQAQGWQVGTVTSVPFNHASPAAMYTRNVSRNDYHDLARQMLGLGGRVHQLGRAEPLPGLDIVLGTGFVGDVHRHGAPYIAHRDRMAADLRNGGRYIVTETTPGISGSEQLLIAAERARHEQRPLFGCFGMAGLDHLPYQTTDRRHNPAPGVNLHKENYDIDTLFEQPRLAEMTDAALSVFGGNKAKKPFALFVEAGDIDWALHDNNLDNAVGAVYSGEEAFRSIVRWVETYSDWQESAVLVSADHGHLLNIHHPQQLAALASVCRG